MYSTTGTLASDNAQNTKNQPPQAQNIPPPNQQQYMNPMYDQTSPMPPQQQAQGQNMYINPMYGQTAPMAAQNVQQQNMYMQGNPNPQYYQQQGYVNPMYGQTGPMAAQNIQQQQQNPYINPMYGQTAPMAAQNVQAQQQQQISLSSKKNEDDDEFGGFQSANSNANEKVSVR